MNVSVLIPQIHLQGFVVLKNFMVCAAGILSAATLYLWCILLHSSCCPKFPTQGWLQLRMLLGTSREASWPGAATLQPREYQGYCYWNRCGHSLPPATNTLLGSQRRLETETSPRGEQEKLQQCLKSWGSLCNSINGIFINTFYKHREMCLRLWHYYDIWNNVCITWQRCTQTKC